MTQTSYPWGGTAVGDAVLAPYTDDAWSDMWRKLFTRDRTLEGILDGYASELIVTNPSGNTIRVASGAAIVDGKFFENTANVDEDVTIDGTYRVVLQKDWTAQTVRIAIESGGVASIVQNDGVVWEIMLAEIDRTGGVFTITDLRVNAHYSTGVSTVMLEDLAVTTAKLADDSVDDAKAGDRVPKLSNRQGGHATNWKTAGVTDYVPDGVLMQVGSVEVTIGIGSISASVAVVFPAVFPYEAQVFVSVRAIPSGTSGVEIATAAAHVIDGTTGFTIWATRSNPLDTTAAQVVGTAWLAIGPG